ncbi:hypothetical protein DFH27DRAFT_226483 [Peziza echinospora]|nr:hypothetical protein DFH27DRAFT_226483 [Peziza echinospora]
MCLIYAKNPSVVAPSIRIPPHPHPPPPAHQPPSEGPIRKDETSRAPVQSVRTTARTKIEKRYFHRTVQLLKPCPGDCATPKSPACWTWLAALTAAAGPCPATSPVSTHCRQAPPLPRLLLRKEAPCTEGSPPVALGFCRARGGGRVPSRWRKWAGRIAASMPISISIASSSERTGEQAAPAGPTLPGPAAQRCGAPFGVPLAGFDTADRHKHTSLRPHAGPAIGVACLVSPLSANACGKEVCEAV